MRTVALLLALCLGVVSSAVLMAADEATEEEARQLYEGAFSEGLKVAERLEALEQVAKDYADTAWADDALWVLGEVARKRRDSRRAVLFGRQLLEREVPPSLEPFTEQQAIYARSRLPRVLFLLGRTGHLYRHEGAKAIAIPFDPLQMVVSEGLALQYEKLGLHELALKEYRRAIAAAPPGGMFARIYVRRADRLEKKVERLKRLRGELEDGDDGEGGEEEPPPPPEEGEEEPQDDGTEGDDQQQESSDSGEDSD